MRRAVVLALLLTACGGEEPPAPPPTPGATPSPRSTALPPAADLPGALPAPELQGAQAASGAWVTKDGQAVFGDGILAIGCDRARRKLIVTRGGAQGLRLRIVTDVAAATLNATASPQGARAETDAADPFVRALAKASGAIGVQVDDGDVLAVPADAAMRDRVADCARP